MKLHLVCSSIPYGGVKGWCFVPNTLKERSRGTQGLTLIELLVVILIIGILAAIMIPAFLNHRDKEQDRITSRMVDDAAKALRECYTDGAYKNCKHPNGVRMRIKGQRFTVAATSESRNVFVIRGIRGDNSQKYCFLPKGKSRTVGCPKGWPDTTKK